MKICYFLEAEVMIRMNPPPFMINLFYYLVEAVPQLASTFFKQLLAVFKLGPQLQGNIGM